jgi:hypothetical protein
MASIDFSIDDLPVSSNNFEPIPDGWYDATIVESSMKDTKAGTGEYIAVRYKIDGPSHQGRALFGNLNVKNPNPKAEEIGRQQLGEIMRAIGLVKVTNTDQLIGGQLSIKIVIKRDQQYGDGNDIKGFKAIAGVVRTSKASAPATLAKTAPPWSK